MKPLRWVGRSRNDLRTFAEDARRVAGKELLRVQLGFEPTDWKPMASVGAGVKEIRIHSDTAYRVLYIAKFDEAVYVLHAFVKKSRATAKHDIDLAKERLRQLIEARGKR